MNLFSGLNMGLGNISQLSGAQTRSVSAENVYGEKGRAGMAEVSETPQPEVLRIGQVWDGPNNVSRELGQKWKIRPWIKLPAGQDTVIMDVDGPGCIQHIFMTMNDGDISGMRDLILRMYWDGEKTPSVECPVCDFFCNGFALRTNIVSLPINVNPTAGMNCFFPMPFSTHARVTVENRNPVRNVDVLAYNITYTVTEVGSDEARFHAQFRRVNPLPYKSDYTILDDVSGMGHYVGTHLAWQQNNTGWWGEGEIKFFIDGDGEFPSICGNGTEDYFGGAWAFGTNYSAPFMGYPVGTSTGKAGDRHSMYRFHIMDPIRFKQDLRVIIQALGWRSEGRLMPLQDDISSVAYWYQAEPHAIYPVLPDRDYCEVI